MPDIQTKLQETIKSLQESGDLIGSTILAEESASGQKIPSSHLNKIRKWIREDIDVKRIHTFPFIMIDTAPTRNLVIYTAKTQKKSLNGWFGRTVLFNSTGVGNVGLLGQADHYLQASSQVARIYDAKMVKTPDGEIGTLGWVFAVEGVDPVIDSFINKLNAGVLREVSIHVAVAEGIFCSIDEKQFASWSDDKTEENEKIICFDHQPGNKYGKQICYMSTGDHRVEPLELSVVACPGSINARVLKPDEVEDYTMTSLSEALGGSKEVKENIMAKKNESSDPALKTIFELAKEAGLLISEKKDDKKESKCGECGHQSHEGSCSANCNSCKESKKKDEKYDKESLNSEKKDNVVDDGDDDDKKKKKEEEEANPDQKKPGTKSKDSKEEEESNPDQKKPGTKSKDSKDKDKDDEEEKKADPPEGDDDTKESFLFIEGDCPACGRSEASSNTDEEAVKNLRAKMTEQVQLIITEAKKRIKANSEKAAQYDAIFSLFVEETASLAVETGLKKFQERDNYIETLKSLSFNAVQEIRLSLSAKQKPSRENKVEELHQSMLERAKQNLGTVIEEKDGKKKSVSGLTSRPKFAV